MPRPSELSAILLCRYASPRKERNAHAKTRADRGRPEREIDEAVGKDCSRRDRSGTDKWRTFGSSPGAPDRCAPPSEKKRHQDDSERPELQRNLHIIVMSVNHVSGRNQLGSLVKRVNSLERAEPRTPWQEIEHRTCSCGKQFGARLDGRRSVLPDPFTADRSRFNGDY